jgi:hypothetical protein
LKEERNISCPKETTTKKTTTIKQKETNQQVSINLGESTFATIGKKRTSTKERKEREREMKTKVG